MTVDGILRGVFGAALIAACNAEVRTTNASAGAGATVDPGCFEACVDKGESAEVCTAFCMDKGTSSGSKGSSVGTGTGGGPDPAIEKPCINCLYEESVGTTCEALAATCKDSVACTQLQWCPTLCGEPNCWTECNDVIPSGVKPLSALVQCMACGEAPCADACAKSVVLSYCDDG
jgi:hypothetical protein